LDQLEPAHLYVVVGADGEGLQLLLRADHVLQRGTELSGKATMGDDDDAYHLSLLVLCGGAPTGQLCCMERSPAKASHDGCAGVLAQGECGAVATISVNCGLHAPPPGPA